MPHQVDGWLRPLGSTGLTVSAVCAGGAPLGSMPENFGRDVPEAEGIELVEAILDSPIRCIDTSNGYSDGRSEQRIGDGISRAGGLPDDFLVLTKTDARQGDYSGARVRTSVRESAKRLGLSPLPMVYLHDPEYYEFATMTAPGGAVDTLVRMREAGEIGHIGLAGGDVREMTRYLDLGVFEVVLTHNRWTLVDRSASALIEQAVSGGVAVVNAAIYGGGILAGPRGGTNYAYRPAGEATLAAVSDMAELCTRWGTDLATAALQFSVRDPRIATTVVGFSRPSRLNAILAAAETRLPEAFWYAIDEFVPAPRNWLDFEDRRSH